MKRVVFISSYAPSLANFRGPLIRHLIESGFECVCFAPDFDDETRKQVDAIGAEPLDYVLERVRLAPARDIINTVSLSAKLREQRPDISITYFAKPVIFGTIAAALAGVRTRVSFIEGLGTLFMRSAEPLPLKRRLLRGMVKLCYRMSLRLCHRVFFCNPDDLEFFVTECGVDRNKAALLPGIGVDLQHYEAMPPAMDRITFVMLGRLLVSKGVRVFADAARLLSKEFPTARWLLVGDVDVNPDSVTRAEVEGWVSEGLVEWTGQVSDVRPWLAQSSVLVLPSRYPEGLPRSLMEGLAAARPVITSDSPGCRETVTPGVNGFLLERIEPEALARAMRRFLQDPTLVESMGSQSRELAVSRFDANEVNRQILISLGLDKRSAGGTRDAPISNSTSRS